jgi:hypothetical protein
MSNPSNALVPVGKVQQNSPQTNPESGTVSRPLADFIAHLIATSGRAPQTCSRRRAEPEEVVAAYGVLSSLPSPAGLILSRSL